jgi:quercetin 2,3-dioxygenase
MNHEKTRDIERLIKGIETSDGAGVKLTRVLTQDLQRRLDPYLMLDAFRNNNPEDYIGGFPDHPHRGFETITYMIAGRMQHHDSAGNAGLLEPGGVQWMTAGSGLIHSEIPQQDNGLMEGFQLWLNLPGDQKMTRPAYRDLAPSAIPELETRDGVRVRVIAGESHGVTGAVQRAHTKPLILVIHMPAGSQFTQALESEHNAFLYTYRGEVHIQNTPVTDRFMGLLSNDGDCVVIQANGPARVLLVSGRPLNEPIAQYGPFVMNTTEQIQQTLRDYRDGKFEAAAVQAL